jgi:carboxypeptidase C (cathepsin A)
LNEPEVQSRLGVDTSFVKKYSPCSDDVFAAFTRSDDVLHSSFEYVAGLLERKVRVLLYVGTYDWICNWVGNERWTLEFPWSGHDDFVKQELRDWKVAGKVAGRTRSAHGLTFATVNAAGHLVRCI